MNRKHLLFFTLIAVGVVGTIYFYSSKQSAGRKVLFNEETTAFLKSRVELRTQQKYLISLIPIYEKILEKEPNNEAAKRELEKIQKELHRLEEPLLRWQQP